MATTVFKSIFPTGARVTRHDEFLIVYMRGGAFVTTPGELLQHQNWARRRASSGSEVRDSRAFTNRFETLLARVGSGLTTKGSYGLLQGIVKAMTTASVPLGDWAIPPNLNDRLETMEKPVIPAQAGTQGLIP